MRRLETSSCPLRLARSAKPLSSSGPRTISPLESAPVWLLAAKAERETTLGGVAKKTCGEQIVHTADVVQLPQHFMWV